MLRTSILLTTLASILALGCGDDGGGTSISCDWFVEDNCYKQAVAAVYACVDTEQMGAFNSETTQCDVADGTSYEFASPPPLDFDDEGPWDFEITKDGAFCASIRELGATGDDGFSIETSLGEFRQTSIGFDLLLTCPDGERYQIGAFDALDCGFDVLPGYASAWSSSSVSFNLLGNDSDGSLLSCSLDSMP